MVDFNYNPFWFKQTTSMTAKPSTWNVSSQQMQSYKLDWTSTKYPWLDKEDEKVVENLISWYTWYEKLEREDEVYKTYLDTKQAKKFLEDRRNSRAWLDTVKPTDNIAYKTSVLTDMIRTDALEKWQQNVTKIDDDTLIKRLMEAKPELQPMFVDYLNGKIKGSDIMKQISPKVEEQPVEIEDEAKDIWDISKDIWMWAGVIAGWLWALELWGIASEYAGKQIYWLTLPPLTEEAKAIQSYKAWTSSIKPRTTVESALDTSLISKEPNIWTRTMLWTQAERAAWKLFKEKINPAFQTLDQKGIMYNIDNIIQTAKDNVNSSKMWVVRKKELIEWLDALADDYVQAGVKDFSPSNLQIEKSTLDEFTPDKVFKWKQVASAYNQAKNKVANVMRDLIHKDLTKELWEDSVKIYKDYANLKNLSNVWVKSLTEWGRKGWAWTMVSRLIDELATPITTTAGKVLYKWGKLLKWIPEWIINLAKKSPKAFAKWLSSMAVVEPDFSDLNITLQNNSLESAKTVLDKLKNGKVPKTSDWIYWIQYKEYEDKWYWYDKIISELENDIKFMENNKADMIEFPVQSLINKAIWW